MIGTTVGSLLDRITRDAVLGSRGPFYTLASTHTSGASTIVLNEEPEHVAEGAVVSIGTSLYYVLSADPTAKTLNVITGYLGSTDATYTVPKVVGVDERFPKASLLDYAQQEILSWGAQIWKVTTQDIAVDTAHSTYDLAGLTGDIYFLLDVRRQPTAGAGWWGFTWDGDSWPRVKAKLMRNADTAVYPTGRALRLRYPPPFGTELRVAVAQPITLSAWTEATDLVADVGLRTQWLEILEHGCRMRALQTSVIARTDWRASGHARLAEEASVGDQVRALQMAQQMHQIAFAKAANELRGEWPYRST